MVWLSFCAQRSKVNVSDYVQMDVFIYAKMPNMLKFWDKDVSKRPEFPELRPKFERWM